MDGDMLYSTLNAILSSARFWVKSSGVWRAKALTSLMMVNMERFFQFDVSSVKYMKIVEIPLAPEQARVGIDIRVVRFYPCLSTATSRGLSQNLP